MQWNLRMVAAQRGIWRASDLRRLLAEAGLEISGGKMSYLWSGQPNTLLLYDLEVICRVLDCQPNDLLVREPAISQPQQPSAKAAVSTSIRPAPRRGRRALPPV